MRTISVVVPVYNGALTVADLVAALEPVLRRCASGFEVVLVNDGSPDHSWAKIEELARAHSWVRGINLMRNYGQHNALLCGIRAARFDTIVTMDDDLQHPPDQVPLLLAALDRGADVVYGTPEKMTHSASRNLLSRLTKVLMARAMGGAANVRNINAFRAFRTTLRDAFAEYRSPALLLDVLLSWATQRFDAVPVRHEPRRVGTSNYNIMRLVNQLMLLLTGFSTAPLRFASFVGFAFTLIGVGVFSYAVIHYFLGGTLPGFPFLASVIALFAGAQLFALGIMGEYLARMFNRTMDRPPYAVREEIGGSVAAKERVGG